MATPVSQGRSSTTTIVLQTTSPNRWQRRFVAITTRPTAKAGISGTGGTPNISAEIIGPMSTVRMMFRRTAWYPLTGRPLALNTRIPIMRLPGVCPFQ